MIYFKKILTAFIFFLLIISKAEGTHIMGGELSYRIESYDLTDRSANYTVDLNFYRYCIFNNDTTAPLPTSFHLQVFAYAVLNNDTFPLELETEMTLNYSDSVLPPFMGPACPFAPDVCVQYGSYTANINLPFTTAGYHLCASARARNGTLINIQNPLQAGIVFYSFIPPNNKQNSSAYFTELPLPYVCIQDTITLLNTAYDDDGDVLRYKFVAPIESVNQDTTVVSGNPPMILPFYTVMFTPGYSVSKPFGPGSFASIDSISGLTKFFIPNQGFYVVAIEVDEYRNGVLISQVRRDYQVIATACPPNKAPEYIPPSNQTATSFTITEGDTLCLQIAFNDLDNDSLSITATGEVFTSSSINPKATFNNVSGLGTVSSTFCWITQCGYARTNSYQFSVSAVDDGCPSKKKDVIFSVNVLPRLNVLPDPTVTFSFFPPDPFCPGTLVRFEASATNAGAFPVYHWKINNEDVASDTVFSTIDLKNNDEVSLTMTSSSTCSLHPEAIAQPYLFTVLDKPIASFSIQPLHPDELSSKITFINQTTDANNYLWNFSNLGTDSVFSPIFQFKDTGAYNVVLIASNLSGCKDSAQKEITIAPVPTVYVPAAFTPNDDGINDYFNPIFNGYSDFELFIFNRWGNKVFYSDVISSAWDGSSAMGGKCPQGSYIYYLVLKTSSKVKTLNGWVNLIR